MLFFGLAYKKVCGMFLHNLFLNFSINCTVVTVFLLLFFSCSKGTIDETVQLLKKETGRRVKAQGLMTMIRLSKLIPENASSHNKLIQVAKQVSCNFFVFLSYRFFTNNFLMIISSVLNPYILNHCFSFYHCFLPSI